MEISWTDLFSLQSLLADFGWLNRSISKMAFNMMLLNREALADSAGTAGSQSCVSGSNVTATQGVCRFGRTEHIDDNWDA